MDFSKIEKKWQKKWKESGIFEPKIDKKKKKLFFTTPYPYISGSLHIGHGRAVTESDIYVRYKRMSGFNVLYPLAFHITGTPVLGISAAIEAGDEKKISLYGGYVRNYVKGEKEVKKVLQSFKDPWNIVKFFIPKMVDEYSSLGLSIDWSRKFTTGDPDYQKFITWQFMQYKDKGFLVKGSYPVLYCPMCENAVGEDDIQDADTNPVSKQEFTLLKFEMDGSYLVAATLRPETVFGQTNLWVNPNTEYLKIKVGNETWLMSKEGHKKLSYQKKGIEVLGRIDGKKLIGKYATAPGINRDVIILPSTFVNPNVGSGIVTSVPSDAPYDWMALRDLKKNRGECEKYGLDFETVQKIKVIPIINIPGWGDMAAQRIADKMKLKDQNDPKLEEATHEIYREGFHSGKMNDNCGKYAGMKVADAKEKMKKWLIDSGNADVMFETTREAYCRDGTKVFVSVLEGQWFLDFNADKWKTSAKKCLDGMEIIPETMRKLFNDTFEWLDKRPAARKRGIGTPLPYDKEWIIESLSDSTIYMSFYTIKNLIEKYKIKSDQLLPEFFDYVYLGKGTVEKVSKSTKISIPVLKEMRENFDYWYPNDHRHTYAAHLSNHLSFFIFAHAGIFPQKYWPRKISFHGFVQSEGMKMSKSKGNVITLLEIKNKYGADTFRAYISTATTLDGTFDWKTNEAINMQKNLFNLRKLIEEMIKKKKKGNLGSAGNAFVSKFEQSLKESSEALNEMRLRDYGNIVIHAIPGAVRKLKRVAPESEVNAAYYMVAEKYIKMITPVVPHLAEEMWSKNNGKGFVSQEKWPEYDNSLIDEKFLAHEELSDKIADDIRSVMNLVKFKPKVVTIYVSPKWKYPFFKKLKEEIEKTRDIGTIMKKVMDKQHGMEISKLVPYVVRDPSKLPNIVLDQESEYKSLLEISEFLEKEFNCKIEVTKAEDSKSGKAQKAVPGKPGIELQ